MGKSIKNKFYIGETVEFESVLAKKKLKGVIRVIFLDKTTDNFVEYKINGDDNSVYYVPEANIRRIIPTFKPGDRVIVRGYVKTTVVESVYSSRLNRYRVKGYYAPVRACEMTLVPDVIEFGECG